MLHSPQTPGLSAPSPAADIAHRQDTSRAMMTFTLNVALLAAAVTLLTRS